MTESRLDVLERRLEGEFRRYHADAQIRQAALIFVGFLAWELRDGVHDWSVKGMWALLFAAGGATVRQIWKQVPQKLVMEHVAEQQDAERADARAAKTNTGSQSGTDGA